MNIIEGFEELKKGNCEFKSQSEIEMCIAVIITV